MNKILAYLFLIISAPSVQAQTIIQMVEDRGVYKIPCEVNGLKVKMVFDTGAAAVSMSSSFAEMLLDNNYISVTDFTGKAKSMTADGRIIDHTELMIHTLKIGDITVNDVMAIVIDSQDTPLLLGQTAIQKLGVISINGDKLYIKKQSEILTENSTNTHFEKWDAKHYIYSNYTYGFGWTLPKDYEWERVEGTEKHTVFRAEGMPFSVFVNAQVSDKINDLWKVYNQYTSSIEQLDINYEKKTGALVYEREFEKCNLLGQHAIKTTFKEYFKDSRFKEPMETYAEEYIVIHNGYIFTIAVKIPKELYDAVDCSDEISKVFKGFRYSVKQ